MESIIELPSWSASFWVLYEHGIVHDSWDIMVWCFVVPSVHHPQMGFSIPIINIEVNWKTHVETQGKWSTNSGMSYYVQQLEETTFSNRSSTFSRPHVKYWMILGGSYKPTYCDPHFCTVYRRLAISGEFICFWLSILSKNNFWVLDMYPPEIKSGDYTSTICKLVHIFQPHLVFISGWWF